MVLETEARFGSFSINGKQFKPSLNNQQYNDVYYYLLNKYKKFEKKEQEIIGYGDVKNVITNGDSLFILKKKLENKDNTEYGVRIATAEETFLENFDTNGKKVTYTEKRTRISFFSKEEKLVFDLNTLSDGSFSLEIEAMIGYDLNVFNFNITTILQILQESDILIKKSEAITVLEKYKKLTKKNKFIGVQPVTLTNEKINKNDEFAVTKKLDGRRFLLLSYNDNVYAISTKLTVHKLPFINKSMKDYIFDTEYFRNSYNIFDLVEESVFEKRMEKIKEIYKDFKPYPETKMNIYVKKYESSDDFVDVFKNMQLGLDKTIYDGLIIIRKNATYTKSLPLKWKPVDMNTVDFKIKKSSPDNFDLFIGVKDGLEKFAETKVTEKQFNSYLDDTIVEFKYDKKWIPIKQRFDKEIPNFITVAQDNLNATLHPFNPETFSKKTSTLENMRRFHNYVKRLMIDKYKTKIGNGKVLDMACGKGGDLHKYVCSNFSYIEGYDINEESIKEAKSRASSILSKPSNKNIEIVLKVQDLNKNQVVSKNTFDLVVCNFAFHYMYKKMDLFLKSFLDNTKKGSFLLLSFFDGNLVKNIKTKNYEIKKTGDKVNVWIKDSVLNTRETEDIVDIGKVTEYFLNNGLILLENKNFSEYFKQWNKKDKLNLLTEDEKTLSYLNNYMVFIKN